VKLLITSADVLHSLYIPAYRIKEDAVPGRETYLWFLPDETGSYDLFCTEYCGVGHANMTTRVEVLSRQDFDAWYGGAMAPVEEEPKEHKEHRAGKPDGAGLVQTKGCAACHSTDGSPRIGPSFKGLFGKKETVMHDGKERQLNVDEAFIREKILQPEINRIKGFPPIMPSQRGQLTDEEIDAIVDYLKSLQ
jgi:cytochrome c oxidase subunit 2